MDQRIQEQHGALGTDRGRTEAYDAAAMAREHAAGTGTAADRGPAMADQPNDDAQYLDEAETDRGGEGDGATEDASAAEAPAGIGGLFFPEVLAGLKGAEASAREAGRQGLARAYEDLRVKAVANLDIMLAHAQLAQAALKWDGEDFATISTALAQADRCLAEARNAVLGRMQLNEFDAATRAAYAAPAADTTQTAHDAPSA